MVLGKSPFFELLDHLKARADGELSGFQFLAMLQVEAGISFVKTREILGYFDRGWQPLVEPEVINERWAAILNEDTDPVS